VPGYARKQLLVVVLQAALPRARLRLLAVLQAVLSRDRLCMQTAAGCCPASWITACQVAFVAVLQAAPVEHVVVAQHC
jgi:hypothetical protein